MAEFTRAAALSVESIYVRRLLPNGDSEYIPKQFNLVTYDDGQVYIEPVNSDLVPNTFAEIFPPNASETFRIIDSEPFVDADLGQPITGIR